MICVTLDRDVGCATAVIELSAPSTKPAAELDLKESSSQEKSRAVTFSLFTRVWKGVAEGEFSAIDS